MQLHGRVRTQPQRSFKTKPSAGDEQRPLYDVVTSQLVSDELEWGTPDAAARRLEMLDGILVLPVNPDAEHSC